jgi:hypothetical protein
LENVPGFSRKNYILPKLHTKALLDKLTAAEMVKKFPVIFQVLTAASMKIHGI